MPNRRDLLATVSILIPLTSAMASTVAFAQDAGLNGATPASDKPAETIVVTSSRRAESLKNVPSSISVLSAAQVRNSAAQTLDQVLRFVPAVDLPALNAADLHPTADSVSMRGLSGTRALVLLDGLPLNDAEFGSIQWNRVSLENVRQIEIVRGGDATLWGNYAMGGVINILTQAPVQNELLVSGGAGSYGTYRANLFGAYIPVPWARFSVDYGYNQELGFDQIPVDVRRAIDRKTQDFASNVAMTGDFDLAEGLTAGVRVNYNSNSQPIQVTSLSSNYLRNWTYSGHVTKTIGADSSLTAAGFHQDGFFVTNNTASVPDTPSGTAEFVENSHHTAADDSGGSMVWLSSIPDYVASYSAGVDLRQIKGTDNGEIFSDDNDTITHVRNDIGTGKQLFTGVFGQFMVHPIEKLDIQFSARYQYYKSFDGFQTDINGARNLPDHETYSFLPRLSVRYHLTPQFALRAAGYEAFRAPTLDQLYRSISTPTGVFLANSSLYPEKLKGGEAGLDFDLGRLTGQVTGFYNHITNLLTSRNLTAAELPAGIGFGTVNINAGSGRSVGMELEAHYRVSPRLMGIFGYTHVDAPVTSNSIDPESVGKQLIQDPHDKVTLGFTYTGHNGWKFTPQARYLSKSWGDSDHTLPIDGHFVMDLNASYPITRKLEVFGQVENLFNKTYVGYNDGASPPTLGMPLSVFGGIRYRIF